MIICRFCCSLFFHPLNRFFKRKRESGNKVWVRGTYSGHIMSRVTRLLKVERRDQCSPGFNENPATLVFSRHPSRGRKFHSAFPHTLEGKMMRWGNKTEAICGISERKSVVHQNDWRQKQTPEQEDWNSDTVTAAEWQWHWNVTFKDKQRTCEHAISGPRILLYI